MELNYIKSQSSVKPELVDTTSSKKVVYLRKNITEVVKINEISGEEYTCYEYDEVKLTKAQYDEYLKEIEVSNIQQLETDLNAATLRLNELESSLDYTDEQLTSAQLALVDQYEINLVLNEELSAAQDEITMLQLALCDIYESIT